MKKNSKKGFTLVEVMTTVGLLSLVGALCASLIFMGFKHSRQNSERSAFQIGVNKFIAILNNRINSAGNGKVDVKINGDQIEIVINENAEIYTYDSDNKQILLSSDTYGDMTVSPYVKDAVFEYDSDYRLLKVKVQSDIDSGWLETSFYIR